MKRFKPVFEEGLDKEKIRKIIESSKIRLSLHIDDVKRRKGRPDLNLVLDYLENRLDKLYRTFKGRKERIVCCFYLSKKYDLYVIIKTAKKTIYVVTYYYYKKKFKW